MVAFTVIYHVKPQLKDFHPLLGMTYLRYQSSRWEGQQTVFPAKFPPPAPCSPPRHEFSTCLHDPPNGWRYYVVVRRCHQREGIQDQSAPGGLGDLWGKSRVVWNMAGLPLCGISSIPIQFPQDSPREKVLS